MRPFTMLPSLKSRIDFDIKSCICNIDGDFFWWRRDSVIGFQRRLSPAFPAEKATKLAMFQRAVNYPPLRASPRVTVFSRTPKIVAMKFSLPSLVALLTTAASLSSASPDSAQQQVTEAIKAPEVSVVHLWAPWCSNCQAELKSGGWTKMVKENPQTKFLFVSVWNGGGDGRAMLAKYEIADQPNVAILADPGPRGADHIKQFA